MRFLMRHMRIKRRFPFPSYTSLESSVHPDKTGLHQSIPKRGNMIQKLIRLPEVINSTGYQRSNIYLLMSQGQFPKSVSIGGRAVAWLESEVDTWIQERVDLRDHNEITNFQNSVQG